MQYMFNIDSGMFVKKFDSFLVFLQGTWRVASTAESTHAGKCFVPRNQRTTTLSSVCRTWRSLCSSSDKTTGPKFTNLTDVYSNTVSVIFVTKLVKEMEKNRTNILIFSRKNPISSSNSSHHVFRGQIRTLTSSQSELPLRARGEYRDHYRDILLS